MSTQEYGRRNGWVTFAAVAMFAIGFVRIISAFTYFDNADDVNDLTNSIFGDDLWAYGVWDLVIAGARLLRGVLAPRRRRVRQGRRLHLGGAS